MASVPWDGKQYLLADYLKAIEGLGIKKSVYMEVAVKPTRKEQEREAAYILELCKISKGLPAAATISGNPESEDFRDYIMHYKGNPYIKGIRKIAGSLINKAHLYEDPQFIKSVRLLGEMGLNFEMTTLAEWVGHAANLAKACPETRLILDHCGNADPKALLPKYKNEVKYDVDQWKRDMEAVAKNKNTTCKISGIVSKMKRELWTSAEMAPTVNFCLDTFGPDRVIFGGDWPVCTVMGATLREWVMALREIIASRPLKDQRKLMRDNALKLYTLA